MKELAFIFASSELWMHLRVWRSLEKLKRLLAIAQATLTLLSMLAKLLDRKLDVLRLTTTRFRGRGRGRGVGT